MDLLEGEQEDKLDCLIWAVERLVQKVLDTDDLLKEASAVARRIEEWRGTFHVEHHQLPLPVNTSGSQSSPTQGMHGESTASPGSSGQRYDYVQEHRATRLLEATVAPHTASPDGTRRLWTHYEALRKERSKARAFRRRRKPSRSRRRR